MLLKELNVLERFCLAVMSDLHTKRPILGFSSGAPHSAAPHSAPRRAVSQTVASRTHSAECR